MASIPVTKPGNRTAPEPEPERELIGVGASFAVPDSPCHGPRYLVVIRAKMAELGDELPRRFS